MTRTSTHARPAGVAIALAVLASSSPTASARAYEQPPTLRATDVLPKEMVAGPHHRVKDRVVNDGFLNLYQLESEFGSWSVVSTAMLRKRVHEVGAIARMKALEQSEEFKEAVGEDVEELVDAFEHVVDDPVGAAEGAVSGVKKIFDLTGEAWRSRHTAKEGSTAGRLAKTVTGFDKAKREYAAELGVDPYSTNRALHDELDRIATVATSGGLLASTAKAMIPGVAGAAVAATGTTRALNDLLATTSSVELRVINREKLLAMKVHPELVELFLDNPALTPTHQTFMVGALEQMEGVDGRQGLIRYAIGTTEEDVADYRTRVAWLYARYHRDVEALSRFIRVGRAAVAASKSGQLVLAAAVDHVPWTPTLEGFMDGVEAAVGNEHLAAGRTLWATGTVTPEARQQLKKRGWLVRSSPSID